MRGRKGWRMRTHNNFCTSAKRRLEETYEEIAWGNRQRSAFRKEKLSSSGRILRDFRFFLASPILNGKRAFLVVDVSTQRIVKVSLKET